MPISRSRDTGQGDALAGARQLLANAINERSRLVKELDDKRKIRDTLLGKHGAKDERSAAAQDAYQNALNSLVAMRQAVREAQTSLGVKLAAFLDETPTLDITRLTADMPIVMLPVRLETRFVRGHSDPRFAAVLKVRIYPDSISADNHEPLLSEDERDAGLDYWNLAWQAGDERDAWSALLKETSPERAAWIVLQTTPTNMDQFPAPPGAATTGDGAAPIQPQFSEVARRPRSWRRATQVKLLPDRWLVRAFRRYPAGSDEDVHEVFSKPVRESLGLTLNLSRDGNEDALDDSVVLSDDGLKVDPEILWTFDFNRALDAGMAVKLDLTQRELDDGFARILVVGIKSSLSSAQTASRLGSLVDSHHYSRGFAFVSQGTPTNNTKDGSSPYPTSDPNGAASFVAERSAQRNTAAGDGARVATALGIPVDHLQSISGTGWDEQSRAQAMAEALWPATIGYFLEQLMAPYVSDEVIEQTRQYFVQNVRARGPWPAFRVGEVPYGLLPVTSVERWEPGNTDSGPEKQLPGLLKNARAYWQSAAQSVAHVGQSNDPDKDLLSILGLDASTREVFVRTCLGPQTLENTGELIELPTTYEDSPQGKLAKKLAAILGADSEWAPRAVLLGYGNNALQFTHGLVQTDPSEPVSETRGLKFDYINWIRNADPVSLRDEMLPSGVDKPRSLLYLILRHAAMTEYSRQAKNLLIRLKMADNDERIEREFVNIMPSAQSDKAAINQAASRQAGMPERGKYKPTIWDRFNTPVQGVTGNQPLGKYLATERSEAEGPEDRRLREYRESLAVLEGLPSAELERLFSETLDVCSHRLDAWIASLAKLRLEKLRARNPRGCYIGGYGWVESLRADSPATQVEVRLDEKRTVMARQDAGGGFIHAPSMNQAIAAAVLRNGYLTRSGSSQEPYAVNLNSARVRKALWFIDAVRDGQPIGAALGYQFERGLHEGHPGLELDKFIDDFRNQFPLVANKTVQSGLPAESIAARNVVDGQALRAAWRNSMQRKPHGIDWRSLVPQPNSEERAAIEFELRALDDIVDALSDLLLAESVYQIVIGNSSGASASLDTMAKGVRPPDPQVVRTPRGGTDLTHRVMAVLGGELPLVSPWKNITQRSPRALAEPILNDWVGQLLDDPHKVLCQVVFTATGAATNTTQTVSLADIMIEPLDVLAMARLLEEGSGADFARGTIAESELGRRILDVGLGTSVPAGPVQIIFEMSGLAANERGFPELLEVARAINVVLGFARAMRPADLLPPQQAGMASSAGLMVTELSNRATAALSGLQTARGHLLMALTATAAVSANDVVMLRLSLNSLRAALQEASSLGVISAFPVPRLVDLERERAILTELGNSVAKDLNDRHTKAQAEPNPVLSLQCIFGRQFLVLPRFVPPNSVATGVVLDEVLSHSPHLGPYPRQTIAQWFMQAARVRKPLGHWRQLALYTGTHDQDLTAFDVAQFPYVNGADWIGLNFGSEDKRPASGSTSLLIHRYAQPAVTQAWAGIQLDEWQEKIASRHEDTAVAFHYDSPDSEAPQSVLLAVHPKAVPEDNNLESLRWDMESLVDTLNETLDMAKMRAVTAEQLTDLSQILPMTYLAANPANEAISTSFVEMVMLPALILASES